MESRKAPINYVIAFVATICAATFLPGLYWTAQIGNMARWRFGFAVPYALLFLAFLATVFLALRHRTRGAAFLMLAACAVAAGLFAWDVSQGRYQNRIGMGGEVFYWFWPWY